VRPLCRPSARPSSALERLLVRQAACRRRGSPAGGTSLSALLNALRRAQAHAGAGPEAQTRRRRCVSSACYAALRRRRHSRLARRRCPAGTRPYRLAACAPLTRHHHRVTSRSLLRRHQLAKTTGPPCALRCSPQASRPSSWPPPPRASRASSPSGARVSSGVRGARYNAKASLTRAFSRHVQCCAGGCAAAVVPVVPARRRVGLDGRGGGAVVRRPTACRAGAPLRGAPPLRFLRRA